MVSLKTTRMLGQGEAQRQQTLLVSLLDEQFHRLFRLPELRDSTDNLHHKQ